MSKILAFSGSSSSKSINQKVVHATATMFDIPVTVIDIRDYPLPIYSSDEEEANGFPENATKLRALFSDHSGFLISSPEYNGSMPAIFKNVIDWISRMEGKIFQEKPVLLLSTSPGAMGGNTNLENLATTLVPRWGSDVVAHLSIGRFYDVFDEANQKFTDQEIVDKLSRAVAALTKAVS